MTRNHPLRLAAQPLLLLALVVLSGCSVFQRPALDQAQYLLSVPPPVVVAGRTSACGTVEVSRVTAVAPFDGLGFVYAQADGTWRTDNYAGWIASPSSMLTSAFISFLSDSGQCGFVTGQGASASADSQVALVLEKFCADYTDPSGARAIVQIRWYRMSDAATGSALRGTGLVVGAAPVAQATPGSVADALGAATAVAFGEILAGMCGNQPIGVQ